MDLKMNRKIGIQKLEDRQMFAGDVVQLAGSQLSICGTNGDDVIQVDQIKGTNTVSVVVNGGDSQVYAGVKSLLIVGGNGNDDIAVNTYDDADFLISSLIAGGNGDDTIQGGGGSDVLDGGNGDDILTNFVTDENYNPVGRGSLDVLLGGNGNDTLWGGWGIQDTLDGGNGDDSIYDIVGGRNVVSGGRGDDFIIARSGAGLPTDPLNNPGALVSDFVTTDRSDSSVVLFDAATQAGGPIVIGKTLYVLNLGTGNIQIDQDGNTLTLNYNGQISTYDARDITAIAGLGGNGNDTFTNNTSIAGVFYGQGGNDVLLGGDGRDVLKGGNGNDVIDGRGGEDDITGDAGADTLLSAGDKKSDIVRFDALDTIFTDIGRDRRVKKTNLSFA
jgi:Ca2+-binding RTX toxin-like protein